MIRRIITAIVAFILGAACAVGGMFVYRKVKPNKAVFSPTAVAMSALHASANPYEDPDDPNTTESGTCFSTDTITGYFMEIKLSKQTTGIIAKDYKEHRNDWCGATIWNNKMHDATALLTFVDIKYNDQPVFVSVFTKVLYEFDAGQMYPRLWAQEDFTEENDNAIRIPASYYNFMQYAMQNQGASLRRFKLTFMKNEGRDVMPLEYTQEIDVRLYTKDIPANSDDPVVTDPVTGETVWNPNFQLDNWAGIMAAAKNATGCSVDAVPVWVWWILIGLAALAVLMVVIRLLRWGLGKR